MSSYDSNLKLKKYIKLKFITFTTFLFLLYFFSNNLIYAQNIQKSNDEYLIPIGNVLQIDAELKHIIVKNATKDSPFETGDSIIKINNNYINNYGEYSDTVYALSNEDNVSVLILRSNNKITINTNKKDLEKINFNNSLSGFATLTYINPNTNEFGAVAHPISIGNSRKIPIKNGTISSTTNINIQKSCKGSVGCINAKRNVKIGEFNKNTNYGIKGNIQNFDTENLKQYKMASLDEVKLGKAHLILQTNSNKTKKYEIQVINIQNQKYAQSKTIKFKILDEELLNQTGGVVQGMSGTPIVQDDKIIGAVSHAVENDPSYGYAIFIQWMVNENK